MRRTYNVKSIPFDIKPQKSFVSSDQDEIRCCVPPLDATSFEKVYSTIEKLVCSAVSEEKICNSCATCMSHTLSHGTTESNIHLRLV